ncbi:MAG: hypothetical protein NZ518_06875 [Dehalococcoidia bacterium]|nr:hypothetical protein [Dehalococcoidia bacterium]
MASLDAIIQANPNFQEQVRQWQIARTRANEDAYDWAALRTHLQAIGSPDPGDEAPAMLQDYNWTLYARDRVSPELDRMLDDNLMIRDQMNEWQIARTRANEDAYNWEAFRGYIQGTGAKDPGPVEPPEFRQYDWTKYQNT